MRALAAWCAAICATRCALALAACLQAAQRGRRWWASQPHHVPGVLMLLAAWAAFYAWHLAPAPLQAEVWNITGSAARLLLVVLVVLAYRSWAVSAPAAWWAVEELQVLGCGLLWMASPWPLDGEQGRCSDKLGLPMAAVGSALAAVAAWVVYRHIRPARPQRGGAPRDAA